MRLLAILLAVLASGTLAAGHAYAAPPPPPPSTPVCKMCVGPPPPPSRSTPVPPTQATPVPTLAPTAAAPQRMVAVHLTPSHVKRGHAAKIAVTADGNATVTVNVRYRHGRSHTYHLKLGDSGTLTASWKVPKSAPTGKAAVTVRITGSTSYSATLSFTVT